MATLELSNVTKRFKDAVVLDQISLAVEDGEMVVVFGPSGAGKTVLLRLIAGVIEPEAGEIRLGGENASGVPPERRGVGMAFQNFALFPHMSAFENIASPLRARRAKGGGTVEAGVQAVARLLKIEHVLDHAPRALSNGQKQRTALARALAAKPGILLLDDPLRNVDAKLRFEMRLELPRLLAGYGSTVLYVTQDYKEAMALGHRIAVLADGRFVQVGTPEQIYQDPGTVAVARLFGDPTINLLPVRPERGEGGVVAGIGGSRVMLGEGFEAALGRDCALGIRPEAVRFCEADAPNALPVQVEAVTPLNEKQVSLLLGADGLELLASNPSEVAGPPADSRVHVQLPAGALLLFDRKTGERLAAHRDRGRG